MCQVPPSWASIIPKECLSWLHREVSLAAIAKWPGSLPSVGGPLSLRGQDLHSWYQSRVQLGQRVVLSYKWTHKLAQTLWNIR